MTEDILFVNTIPFFMNLSRKFCFTMVHHIVDRRVKTIYTTFNEVCIYYRKWEFRIINLHIYGEFAPPQSMITEQIPEGPTMNLTRANNHVIEIDRRIRVVKERAGCVRHSPPFNRIPRILLIHI